MKSEEVCTAPSPTDGPTEFYWSNEHEPHARRRREIVARHPEVLGLYGPDSREAVFASACILIQFAVGAVIGFYAQQLSWGAVLVLTYCVSGTINHSLFLAMHECAHSSFFTSKWQNEWFAVLVNLPTGIPAAITFKRYHMEHHAHQGVDGVDMDIPTHAEGWFFRTPARKLLWVVLMPFMYAFRPLLMKPKPMSLMEAMNWLCVAASDVAVLYWLGPKTLFYFVGGTFLGTGLHPLSGHFIAEHFVFIEGQETYSYYGPLNWLTYNVGYHNEHHDFPRIPGSRLPALKKMAPDYYDNLPAYSSWSQVLWDFVFEYDVNCFSRIKRRRQVPNAQAGISDEGKKGN
ncbi:unnamed protein product [Vitrella brassicaformis CCMP3155]|uniref:sphingolipid 4-desaturase n=2 Tax=Vitrella brassicaformis TaxID=1169539 RepID=A0A0G4GCX5_VITBC|nr:unnamed protein product [Vitrella brassicaformis CCMP3155]|mmetsp:Transcript_49630/g.124465  ORF Transcript_49630/g.124465 Transcript_49630/m.124465 type:complete len:345 (+) Transcript_49630:113-1147(+)|eukprot:CEM27124.1 unnamed protein product [Vitrella brassicaformis CCMP3155]